MCLNDMFFLCFILLVCKTPTARTTQQTIMLNKRLTNHSPAYFSWRNCYLATNVTWVYWYLRSRSQANTKFKWKEFHKYTACRFSLETKIDLTIVSVNGAGWLVFFIMMVTTREQCILGLCIWSLLVQVQLRAYTAFLLCEASVFLEQQIDTHCALYSVHGMSWVEIRLLLSSTGGKLNRKLKNEI